MGEILEGLPGSKSVARRKRDARNLGDPSVSLKGVGIPTKRRTGVDPFVKTKNDLS